MGIKVDEEGSGWITGGIKQQDGAGRPCMWSPVTGKGATRPHAHSRAGAWAASYRRKESRDGACVAVCWRGCHRRVDRPRAPRNLWFSAVEELLGKSSAVVTAASAAAARRRSGSEKEIRRRRRRSE